MKWRVENKYPLLGEKRERRIFAWKPTKVGDMMVWLETYAVHECYLYHLNGPGDWHEESRNTLEYAMH